MPNCFCYHSFLLVIHGREEYRLSVKGEGYFNILLDVLKDFGQFRMARFKTCPQPRWAVTGVRDGEGLFSILKLLRHRLIIDLAPELNECYALGPYSLFSEDGTRSNARFGDLVNQAKYWRDDRASREIAEGLLRFIGVHPTLKNVTAIAVPPKFNPDQKNLPQDWAMTLADALLIPIVRVRKTRDTGEQKSLPDNPDETKLKEQVANSMLVESHVSEMNVLIVDDTLRYGGTLLEMGRALKKSGARRVYGLCVAKDARGTKGGISLNEDAWK